MASIYNPSDATPDLVDFMADRFDVWPEAIAIDTSKTPAEGIHAACEAVSAAASRAVPAATTGNRFVIDLTALRNLMIVNAELATQGAEGID